MVRRPASMLLVLIACALVAAACGGRSIATTTPPAASTTSPDPSTTLEPATTPPPAPSPSTTTSTTSTLPPATTTTLPPPTTSAPTAVTTPGTQSAARLEIHLTFRSEVNDVTTRELQTFAMTVLTDRRDWGQAGFTFVADESSDLTVVLAEPNVVDDLCLPLETKGYASCQNGAVVALNAVRWREGIPSWDGSIDDYRTYLVTHEVGHLLGLRHPADRCPDGETTSAVMEPQTAGLVCAGNGWPLRWEVTWATNRPAVIAPLPEWDGPRPEWP